MPNCRECLHDEMCFSTHTGDSPVCCDFLDAARYHDIMRAEREGRLVILPCKFGADLWWIDDEVNEVKCEEGDVKGFVVLKDGVRILDQSDEWGRIGTQYYHLSRESAEKALEEAK